MKFELFWCFAITIIFTTINLYGKTDKTINQEFKTYQTRIGEIVQSEKIPSQSGARDIGGAVVTSTGRIVIAAGTSDGELNHPYKIVITDDGGRNIREVFSMPASEKVTYHTLGLTYSSKHDVIVSLFGRNDGYKLLDRPFGKVLPVSPERYGKNESFLVISWDDGETWDISKRLSLPKSQHSESMIGGGIEVGDEIFFPRHICTTNSQGDQWRYLIYLAQLKLVPKKDGSFSCYYDPKFRTLATNHDRDINFSEETIYIENLEKSGYISFTRNKFGPPYRREYDLNHNPICEFERCRVEGFDKRDYNHGHNGPKLIAFGIIRMSDGNLLYASRFYGTEHHRAGNIFMTSTDVGKTWFFDDDYIPWTISPLVFSNSGGGGNPQMYYASDGTLIHLTSEGCIGGRLDEQGNIRLDPPPKGGFYLCIFKGFTINNDLNEEQSNFGTITLDVSTITKIEDVYVNNISILESQGIKTKDEKESLYKYSKDGSRISFSYKKTTSPAFIKLKVVLANHKNSYRSTFYPRIDIN